MKNFCGRIARPPTRHQCQLLFQFGEFGMRFPAAVGIEIKHEQYFLAGSLSFARELVGRFHNIESKWRDNGLFCRFADLRKVQCLKRRLKGEKKEDDRARTKEYQRSPGGISRQKKPSADELP